MTTALEGVRGQRHASAALFPWKDPVPLVQDAGWAPGPVWTGAKISPPPGFDPRTVQPVAQSLYQLCYSAHAAVNSRNKLI
jgi:hypothetical protein